MNLRNFFLEIFSQEIFKLVKSLLDLYGTVIFWPAPIKKQRSWQQFWSFTLTKHFVAIPKINKHYS